MNRKRIAAACLVLALGTGNLGCTALGLSNTVPAPRLSYPRDDLALAVGTLTLANQAFTGLLNARVFDQHPGTAASISLALDQAGVAVRQAGDSLAGGQMVKFNDYLNVANALLASITAGIENAKTGVF